MAISGALVKIPNPVKRHASLIRWDRYYANPDPFRSARQFWARVETTTMDGCWSWKGAKNRQGYGITHKHLGRPIRERRLRLRINAHRLAYELTYGVTVPESLEVCHACDNPLCVNPMHLFLGTPRENALDCEAKGRRVHPVGERNGHARLTGDRVREIRARHVAGGTLQRELAAEYGVTAGHISEIVNRRTWKSIP